MLNFVLSFGLQTSQIHVPSSVDEYDRKGGQGGRPNLYVRISEPLLDDPDRNQCPLSARRGRPSARSSMLRILRYSK